MKSSRCARHRVLGPTLCTLSLATLVALTGCGQEAARAPAASGRGTPPVAVGVHVVKAESVALSTELPGRVSAPMVAEVRPQVRGLIRSRDFTEGQAVKAGQVLYRIEPDSYRVALAGAQASVAKAQATLDAARLTAQRRAELLQLDAVSQQDHQDAQAAFKQAQADLAVARAAEDAARLNLQRTTVTAPISGQVDVSTVTPGALVTADQTTVLTTVRQMDPIQVDISQSTAELLRLKRELADGKVQRVGANEAQVKLLLEDGSTYGASGRLSFSGGAVNTSTGAVTLRARFANPDGQLLPGMYVRAVLETGRVDQGLTVPQQALQRDSRGSAYVLVVDAHQKIEKRPLTVRRALGSAWLVGEGLNAGERVVVEGLQKVKPGDEVQAHPVAPAARP